jgi:hypothetical protein
MPVRRQLSGREIVLPAILGIRKFGDVPDDLSAL